MVSDDYSKDEKKLLKQVSLRVYRHDGMFRYSQAHHYISVGLSAIRCIENAIEKSKNKNTIQTILDFPCGYGRVLRFLKVKFPNAKITVGEVNTKMLDFCSHKFDVETILTDVNFEKLSTNKKFDLIWCGSLITHLNEEAIKKLLKFFHTHLSPNGLCVITTHGTFTADGIQTEKFNYGLTVKEQQQLLDQFYKTGFGYVGQEITPGDGISIVSRDRFASIVDSAAPWIEIFYKTCGWDNHQDVYSFLIKKDCI